uniref:Reverse transcriptase Ty1/copia-type domain-containing protein n=1 Tax=Vitis vinifera TaxID=29760 RepID=A5B705_VITVI|nr:hypothetical protein VITISV_041749 [Vitis vinifera]
MPNITVSEIGGESVQPNTERLVYTQRKTRQKSQSQHVPFGNDQSRPLGTEAPDITGSPTPNLPSIPSISSLDLDIPIALRKEALDDPNWKVAVMEEMNDLRRSGTWELVDLPKEKRIVGCKWVFIVKCKADGSIERYKARLVAKGFTQTYGIDYHETFAPIAKINSSRILLSLVVNFNWPLHQLDIKNAFLNGDLEEKSQANHTIFYKHSKDGKIAILIVYVDDIVLTGSDKEELERLKRRLATEFEIKDLGALKYFLGMEFARSKEGIFVNQRKYVLDLLGDTGQLGCKLVETPIEPNIKLLPSKDDEVKDKEQYQRLVRRLIYLSHACSDIAFSIEAFTYANWAESVVNRRSTSSYCTFVGGNLVTWRSKKQNVVAKSSAEAKFRSIALGICEALWIRRLLEELKISSTLPMKLYCDNKAVILIAHNPVLHD